MNLREFADQHGGVNRLFRRHFEYEVPVEVPKTDHGGNKSVIGGMVYSRALDFAKLGLSPDGAIHAMEQGRLLAEMQIIPTVILSGNDQRNRDGARFSVAGIKEITSESIPFYTVPAVTYPHYCDPFEIDQATAVHGDAIVHMCLKGSLKLWTEPPDVFEARIVSAVRASYRWEDPILFDLNFEQMVLLYFRLLKKVQRTEIPTDGWCPKYGDTIVIANDGTVALFNANLELIEHN